MSDHEEDEDEKEEEEEDVLSHIFAEAEKAEEFYSQLVTSDGLVSSWKQTLERMSKLDKRLAKIEGSLENMFKKFTLREDFLQVTDRHAAKIQEFEQTISELVTLGQRLSSSEERHEISIEDLKERMSSQEKFKEETLQELQAIETRSSKRHEEAVNLQVTACESLQKQVDELALSTDDLQVKEKEGLERDNTLKEEIETLHNFVMGEGFIHLVEKFVDERLLDYIKPEDMPAEREKIVGMVEERLIVPIRQELHSTNEVIDDHKKDAERKDDHLHRICTTIEHRISDTKEYMLKQKNEIMDEVEHRAKVDEMEVFEQRVSEMVTEAKSETVALKNKCVSKLNEFSDHFAKIHVTMRDHEHCLTHHAEEIENRSTKYGVLTLQNRFDQYVTGQKYETDMDEMKRTVEWQGVQIEGLAMGGSSLTKKDTSRKHKPPPAAGETSGGNSNGPGAQQPSTGDNDEAEDEEGEKTTVYELQKQLELLAMGVLWLSHLALRQPELGGSRQFRLESEQDLIGHLKNVRHWITHRTAPGDWDPSALLSSALHFTHPKDEELPGPLPITTKPPGSASSFGRPRPPGSAGSTIASSAKTPVTPRNGMKREFSAPLQTVAGLLGPSPSATSLGAQSGPPGMKKDTSQKYFDNLPPSRLPPTGKRQPARPAPMRRPQQAEDLQDLMLTSEGMKTVFTSPDNLIAGW